LIEAFPRIDDETLHDTLEGITTLEELIAETIRSALLDASFRTGLNQRLDDMKERASRLEHRAAKKRQFALEAMSDAGLKKLEQADFTACGCALTHCRGRKRDPVGLLASPVTKAFQAGRPA
jgi:hypothetical protein